MSGKKMSFGEHIKQLRQNTRNVDGGALSLRQLAELINVSPTYLSKIERDIHPASPAVIERLAKALDVSKDTLFARAERISPDIEESFASSRAPDMLGSFIRRAASLPPNKLRMANRILGAMHETGTDDDSDNDDNNNNNNKGAGPNQKA